MSYRTADPSGSPSNDPARLAHLRAQAGRPRVPSLSLSSVLGGTSIRPGREQEAWAVWENLYARAKAGDVAASEDMAMLTMLLANELLSPEKAGQLRTLTERTLEAAVLPRHKQAQLGRLCRMAGEAGDRPAARAALAAMTVDPPDIDSDTEYRVSAATLATLERDAPKVLALLGQRKNSVPIDESFGQLATVLRANAHEIAGDVSVAAEELGSLPHPGVLEELRASFPSLRLCPRSAVALQTERRARGGQPRDGDRGTGFVLGVIFGAIGLFLCAMLAYVEAAERHEPGETVSGWIVAVLFTLGGGALVRRGIGKGRRMRYLREYGVARTGNVVSLSHSGVSEGDVPIYALTVKLPNEAGGSYVATVSKKLHEHEVPALQGADVRVLVNPEDPRDIILDE